jgi:hypothetical protein
MERQVSLPRFLLGLESGREHSEELRDSVFPSSVTCGRQLDGEGVADSRVADHRDPPEAEAVTSTELDGRREASDPGKVVVAVDMLKKWSRRSDELRSSVD